MSGEAQTISIVLRCKTCFEAKLPWEGCEAFATDTGVHLHCRTCRGHIATTEPLPDTDKLECELCKRGEPHQHPEFESTRH